MKYHITYSVTPHPEGIEKEAVPAEHGACTALIVGSVLYPEDGSVGIAFHSLDGRTAQPLSDAEMWKLWTLCAKWLSESPDLAEGKRKLCRLVFDAVCAAITQGAGESDARTDKQATELERTGEEARLWRALAEARVSPREGYFESVLDQDRAIAREKEALEGLSKAGLEPDE